MKSLEELQREFVAPHADRVSLIYELEDTRLPEAARFLLRVVGSEDQEDVHRIEALKALRDWNFSEHELQNEIGQGLLDVARSSPDELVKTHAVMTLGRFAQCPGVVGFLAQLILDDSKHLDLRHNALESLRPHKHIPEVDGALRQAAALTDSIGRGAQRFLEPLS